MANCARCGADDARWNLPTPAGRVDACDACAKVYGEERKAARKAELAALPRCEVPGCKRRATWDLGAGAARTGFCGPHKKAAMANTYRAIPRHLAGLAMFGGVPTTKAALLARAQGIEMEATA